ncbi:hypothetical protein [Asaia platycodi]|uniref:hypothetical protein n=1 Tax=Asaia platycodi TaxID=610243 RepID=UPI000ACA8D46|nr:hypothetical protein [Asaia platycodi]
MGGISAGLAFNKRVGFCVGLARRVLGSDTFSGEIAIAQRGGDAIDQARQDRRRTDPDIAMMAQYGLADRMGGYFGS